MLYLLSILQHLELVSEFQTVDCRCRRTFFNMKFSSISLIAAALGPIAGSAIATPVPLRARALAVEDLFNRQPGFKKTSALLHQSGKDHRAAESEAFTSSRSKTRQGKDHWERESAKHKGEAEKHEFLSGMHLGASITKDEGVRALVGPHSEMAKKGSADAKQAVQAAKADRFMPITPFSF